MPDLKGDPTNVLRREGDELYVDLRKGEPGGVASLSQHATPRVQQPAETLSDGTNTVTAQQVREHLDGHTHTAAQINSGTAPAGHVLTSAGGGHASWEAPPAGGEIGELLDGKQLKAYREVTARHSNPGTSLTVSQASGNLHVVDGLSADLDITLSVPAGAVTDTLSTFITVLVRPDGHAVRFTNASGPVPEPSGKEWDEYVFLAVRLGGTVRYWPHRADGLTPGSTSVVSLSRRTASAGDTCSRVFEAGSFWTTTGPLYPTYGGLGTSVAIRIPNLAVPQGATITSARLTVYSHHQGEPWQTPADDITLGMEQTNNASQISGASNHEARYQNLGATVVWKNAMAVIAGTPMPTPSLVTMVQQIVNRGGWASGNAVMFFCNFLNKTPAFNHQWRSHENAASVSERPLLEITYEA